MGYEFSDPFDLLLRLAVRLGGERRRGVLVAETGELVLRARFLRPGIEAFECGLEVEVTGAALPTGWALASHGSAGASSLSSCGDPELDALAGVGGDLAEALACLAPPLRAALVDLLSGPLEVALRGGRLVATDPKAKAGDLVTVDHAVRGTLHVARALAAADDTPVGAGLLDRAFDDPAPGVRHAALHLLLAREGTPEARTALERALLSADPRARILAAPHAGDAGRALLFDLAETAPTLELRAEAIAALALAGDADPAAEALFLALLDAPEPPVVRAAIDALAKVGTLAAVAPLLARTGTLFGDRAEEQAALSAVRTIQRRYGGEPGLLSLDTAAGAGELSLPAGEAGALSVGDDEGGGSLAVVLDRDREP